MWLHRTSARYSGGSHLRGSQSPPKLQALDLSNLHDPREGNQRSLQRHFWVKHFHVGLHDLWGSKHHYKRHLLPELPAFLLAEHHTKVQEFDLLQPWLHIPPLWPPATPSDCVGRSASWSRRPSTCRPRRWSRPATGAPQSLDPTRDRWEKPGTSPAQRAGTMALRAQISSQCHIKKAGKRWRLKWHHLIAKYGFLLFLKW